MMVKRNPVKDHARPLSLADYEKTTIDWETEFPLRVRHDLDVRVRLTEAVNRAYDTISDVIKMLDMTHSELPDINSTYDRK